MGGETRQAALGKLSASYEAMSSTRKKSVTTKARECHGLRSVLRNGGMAIGLAFVAATAMRAQDPTGPLTPPPAEEHNVHRVTTTEAAEAPPAKPPAQIIKEFAEKEEKFLRARAQYGYKKSIKLTEFAHDGQPSGEFQLTVATVIDTDGKLYEKIVAQPPSTLHALQLSPEDLKAIARIPAYPLIPSMLAKYELRYVGAEKVDEVDCYIFDAKPKLLERAHALFQGVVWVDKQYLEVVKTYGKWVTDLGDERSPELPFTNFETYRENVEGKYWFPNYSRSDDYLHLKDSGDVPVRLVIKWSEFKPLPVAPVVAPAKP
jgi:hypothetical protein